MHQNYGLIGKTVRLAAMVFCLFVAVFFFLLGGLFVFLVVVDVLCNDIYHLVNLRTISIPFHIYVT